MGQIPQSNIQHHTQAPCPAASTAANANVAGTGKTSDTSPGCPAPTQTIIEFTLTPPQPLLVKGSKEN